MDMNLESVWQDALAQIQLKVSPADFKVMFSKTSLLNVKEGVATIGCPNKFSKEWIESHHYMVTKNAVSSAIGGTVDIILDIYNPPVKEDYNFKGPSLFSTNVSSSTQEMMQSQNVSVSTNIPDPSTGLNNKYTFDNFIIGTSNRLAHAAALAICEKPGLAYNPLFIYGKVGLGKTHLVHAIGNTLLKKTPNTKILYCSSETFLNDMIKSIRTAKNDSFRTKYRQIDVLMIDDIQFIAGKEGLQEEFFHTFNTLHQSNKQIILVSDRPPSDISKLEERLRSRFEGGMVADINTPDFEMRVAILQKKCEDKNTFLSSDILQLIASKYVSNIRELEGALTKVVAFHKISPNLSEDEVQKILGIERVERRKILNPKNILNQICEQYEINIKDLKGDRRTSQIAGVRQIAMYILKKELNLPLVEVAQILGRKDHTTVMHAISKVEKKIDTSISFRDEINTIRNKLLGIGG